MKKILRYAVFIMFAAAVAFVIIRTSMIKSSDILSSVTASENAVAAYETGDTFYTCKIKQELSEDGAMRAYAPILIPVSGEVQITARYKTEILENAGFDTENKPQFKLCVVSGSDDNPELEMYSTDFLEYEEDGRYGVCRAVFDGVTFNSANALELVLTDGEKDYSCFRFCDFDTMSEYKLSNDDIAALTAKTEEN